MGRVIDTYKRHEIENTKTTETKALTSLMEKKSMRFEKRITPMSKIIISGKPDHLLIDIVALFGALVVPDC